MIHSRETASVRRVMLGACVAAALVSFDASAETGSGAASDVAIHVNVLGLAQLDVEPQAAVSFENATEPQSVQDSVASIDLGDANVHLGAGASGSSAEFLPGPTWSMATSNTSIANLDLSAVDVLGNGLLSIGADLVQSQSTIMGYCLVSRSALNRSVQTDDIMFFNSFDEGNLYAGFPGDEDGGNVVLVNPGVSILGIPVSGLPSLPPPNTAIDLAAQGIVGATLILNEQAITGDGVDWSGVTSNAIHLTLDVAGLVTADVTVGHTDAKLDCTQ
ncbi:MAG: hypothetical protein ABW186_08030 [Rhodanobacteraceae bacterium]